MDAPTADLLRRRAFARRLRAEPGPWYPSLHPHQNRHSFGLLVLDGLLVRSVALDRRECPELIGAGDLIRPWDQDDALASVRHDTSWRVLERTTFAVLGQAFALAVCRRPSIMASLLARTVGRARALAFHLAIVHVRHADARLRMLLWHLADRWGRVTSDGVHLPLPLTHELLAHLACLQRPTASTALQDLTRAGELVRRPDGSWLLTDLSPASRVSAGARP